MSNDGMLKMLELTIIVQEDRHTTIRHAAEMYHRGDGGGYYHCSVEIVDCDKCMRKRFCGCTTPEPRV